MSNESSKVPWTGLDVLLFLALWFAAQIVCGLFSGIAGVVAQHADSTALKPAPMLSAEEAPEEKKHHGHGVFQVIEQSKKSPLVFILLFLTIVVAAPLIEEILFRLFLQGWLESKLSQFNFPGASGVAIVAVSLFFALLHGGSSSEIHMYTLVVMFITMIVTSLLIFALGIYYLKEMRNVKIAHSLFGTKKLSREQLFVIAGICLLALFFVIGLSSVLEAFYPDTNTDPIPIFFFSLALGYLYSKTRNLSYCILFHACLNMTSLTYAWFTV